MRCRASIARCNSRQLGETRGNGAVGWDQVKAWYLANGYTEAAKALPDLVREGNLNLIAQAIMFEEQRKERKRLLAGVVVNSKQAK